MTPETRAAILAHARADYPRESCGLILNARGHERYAPCTNIAPSDAHFAIDPIDYMIAEDGAEILAVVHSHPNASARPSQADLVGCEASGHPWVIVSWPTGDFYEFAPTGYEAPLTGRTFTYGVLDCHSLMRDYYRRELGIDVPPRPPIADRPGWWKRGDKDEPPSDVYMEHFAAAGFVRVSDLRRHDMILMQVGSDVANHCALYLGDGIILHHVYGRLSCREVYGGYWRKHTRAVVRRRELIEDEDRAVA